MGPALRQVSEIIHPSQTYFSIADTGRTKLKMPAVELITAAIFGGLLIAAYGHCATLGSARLIQYLDPHLVNPQSAGAASIAYAVIFCGAFAGIVATGADLFTSNVLYTTSYLLTHQEEISEYKTWLRICRLMILSYLGNAFGASVIGGWIFSVGGDYLNPLVTDQLQGVNHGYEMVCAMARGKISHHHPIYSFICNGIGCNFFVAMATWKTKYAQDAVGQYVGAMFPVLAFCLGGFQHIIANMYTLASGVYLGCPGVGTRDIMLRNVLPVTLGNILGGMLVAILGFLMYGNGDHNFGMDQEVFTVRNCDDCRTEKLAFGHERKDRRFDEVEDTPETSMDPSGHTPSSEDILRDRA